MINIGDSVPAISLPDDKGQMVDLGALVGEPYVLFFYPKDDTPTCTKEVCFFRDALPEFKKLDCKVFGISRDGQDSHEQFRDKFSLNFPLLSDEDGTLCGAADVWKLRHRGEENFMGIIRSTVLVDREGKVFKIWRDVDVNGHVEEIIAALQEL